MRAKGPKKTERRERQSAATATGSATALPEYLGNKSDHGARKSVGHRWAKGQSGNPSGRPKVVESIRELARQHGDDAIRELVALLGNPNPKIRLEAAEAILNRGFGRPSQAVELSFHREDLAARIAELTHEERRQVAQGDLRPLAGRG